MNEFRHVDKKAKTKWRVNRIIVLALLVIFGLPFASSLGTVALMIFLAVVILQLINVIAYPIIEYAQWQYMIADDRIEIKKGIFLRSHSIIPISRIQHVSSLSTPMQRMFGLASVSIYTAGGTHVIQELNKDVAAQICAMLQNEVNKRVEAMLAIEQAKLAAVLESQDSEV